MTAVQTRVRITAGPLVDVEGILLEVTAGGRVVVEPDKSPGVRVVIGLHQLAVVDSAHEHALAIADGAILSGSTGYSGEGRIRGHLLSAGNPRHHEVRQMLRAREPGRLAAQYELLVTSLAEFLSQIA